MSFAVLQEFPSDCRPWKWVPDNGVFTFLNETPYLREHYGCLDDCMYVKKGTNDKYCFAPGPLNVICEEYFCGPPECKITCRKDQQCIEDPEIVCVQAPCCARWSCESDIYIGYLTINENGTTFKQTNEDTPDYLKISVPKHNNYPEAVVFHEKQTNLRVSCTQDRDTAAPVEWLNTTEVMENVKANKGNVIDSSLERKQYFVETVTNETIPEDQRPVDIAPDRPIYRSSIRRVSEQEYQAALAKSTEQPICIRYPNTHDLTIREDQLIA